MVFHFCLLLALEPTFYPHQFSQKIWLPFLYINLCPFINKKFSIDSFLYWEGHHWVFAYLFQTTAAHLLWAIINIYAFDGFSNHISTNRWVQFKYQKNEFRCWSRFTIVLMGKSCLTQAGRGQRGPWRWTGWDVYIKQLKLEGWYQDIKQQSWILHLSLLLYLISVSQE